MILNNELADKKPVVSISMTTYNHEKYIAQAIKSVLMQEVDFDYQLVIGEDCSTDHTRDIVIHYANEYPDRIIAILHDKNVGLKANSMCIRKYLQGEFIISLEGDDYWTDKHKLSRQVHFLEKNHQYVGVSHKHFDVNEIGEKIRGQKKIAYASGYTPKNIYDFKEVEKYYLSAHTATILYRNFYKILSKDQIKIYDNCDVVGDRKLNLVLACMGDVYRLNCYMSAYRHHNKSWTEEARSGGLPFYGYKIIPKLEKLAYDMFDMKLEFREGKMRCWYGSCVELLKHFSMENYDAVRTIWKDGRKIDKILFLLTHTVSYFNRR